ncbi:MAG: hypothetical protein H6850_03530 [Alphaproteobacteria bacterium]|nr:MAG: hypothetical protein H6850_03530 [Alphaproteobacteria bacterium]
MKQDRKDRLAKALKKNIKRRIASDMGKKQLDDRHGEVSIRKPRPSTK